VYPNWKLWCWCGRLSFHVGWFWWGLMFYFVDQPGQRIWWKKADLHYDHGNTWFACSIWSLYCKADIWKCFKHTLLRLLMAYEFWWPSLIQPSELWRRLVHVMAGTLTITLVWINAWMYCNCCYNCFVCYL